MAEKKIIRAVATGQATTVAGWEPRAHLRPAKAVKWMSPIHLLAFRAAQEAWTSAGRERPCREQPAGLVVEIDDPAHGWPEWASCLDHAGTDGWRQLPPLWILDHLPNTTASHLAIQFGLRGPVQTVPRAAVLNHHPLDTARAWLARGQARLVLALQVEGAHRARAVVLETGPPDSGPPLRGSDRWDDLIPARENPEVA